MTDRLHHFQAVFYADFEFEVDRLKRQKVNVLMISEVPLKCTKDILQKVNAYVLLYNQCKYVCRIVCWGRPVGLGFVCQAAINLQGSLFSPIWAIFPSHLTCLLAMMLAIGSIRNSSYRNSFEILHICTSNILMLRIRRIDVVWKTCRSLRSDSFRAQVSHPQSNRFTGMAI